MTTDERLNAALAALPAHDMSEAVAARILALAENANVRPLHHPRDWSGVLSKMGTVAASVLLLLMLPLSIALFSNGANAELQVLELPSTGGAHMIIPWQRSSSFVSAGEAPIAHLGFGLGDGSAARAAAVRGERPRDAFALYNAFAYAPLRGERVSLGSELSDCPWAPSHRLLRVQIETHQALTRAAVQLELDPANIAQYRLIGSEASAGTVPANQPVHAGSRIVALFEIELREEARGALGRLVMTGDAPSELVIANTLTPLGAASADFRFTAALAELAQDGDFHAQAIALADSASLGHPERLAFVAALKKQSVQKKN